MHSKSSGARGQPKMSDDTVGYPSAATEALVGVGDGTEGRGGVGVDGTQEYGARHLTRICGHEPPGSGALAPEVGRRNPAHKRWKREEASLPQGRANLTHARLPPYAGVSTMGRLGSPIPILWGQG